MDQRSLSPCPSCSAQRSTLMRGGLSMVGMVPSSFTHTLHVEEHHWSTPWSERVLFGLWLVLLFAFATRPGQPLDGTTAGPQFAQFFFVSLGTICSLWLAWRWGSRRVFQWLGWPAAFSGWAEVVVSAQGIEVAGCGLMSWRDIDAVRHNWTQQRFWLSRRGRYGRMTFGPVPDNKRYVYPLLDTYLMAAKTPEPPA